MVKKDDFRNGASTEWNNWSYWFSCCNYTRYRLDWKIDNLIPINKNKGANLTIGQRIAGMIINGLGFVDIRLYMYAEFLSDKPLKRLTGNDVLPEYFTDDALAWGLDEVAEYGVEKLFASIAYPIALGQIQIVNATPYLCYKRFKTSFGRL